MRADQLSTQRFRIEGHTDAAGTPSYNEDLSQRRALAVLDFLVARGVRVDRLAAEGRGMRELLDAANPLSAENRRVRVVARD
jgi:outer membrane protein OmpA-like peptidoglycan-associated protein